MKCIIRYLDQNNWMNIKEAARFTEHKYGDCKEPTSKWKKEMLLCEHSPIREGRITVELYDVPSFVIGHLVRHKVGFEPYVSSLRDDRTNLDFIPDRNTPNAVRFTGDFQALINISRKRCCTCASKETRQVWQMVIDAIKEVEPELASVMVRECVYRGFCPERKKCGYSLTEEYKKELEAYRKVEA